jgi:O-antigen ligase
MSQVFQGRNQVLLLAIALGTAAALGAAITFDALLPAIALLDAVASFVFYPFGLLQFIAFSVIGEPGPYGVSFITPTRAIGLIVFLRRIIDLLLGRSLLRASRTWLPVVGLLLVLWLGLTLYRTIDLSAGLTAWFTYLQLLVSVVLVADFVREERHLRILLVLLAALGALNGTYAIYQHYVLAIDRVTGIIPDVNPNRFALLQLMVFCFGLPFLGAFTLGPSTAAWVPRLLVVLALPTAYSILLSLSRGAFLAAPATGLYYLTIMYRPNFRRLLVVATTVAIVLALAPTPVFERFNLIPRGLHDATLHADSSARTRLLYLSIGLEMGRDHPLTGVGIGQFNKYIMSYGNLSDIPAESAHNMYVQMFAEGGIPGIALFLALLAMSLFTARCSHDPRWMGTPMMSAAARGAELALVAFSIAGFFDSSGHAKVAWIMMGVAVALRDMGIRRDKPRTVLCGVPLRA